MAGRLTQWGASQLLQTFFTASATPPTSFWLALIRTIPPTPYVSGAELDEPDADDYNRVEILNDLVHWSNDSAPEEYANLGDTSFVPAETAWGPIGFWALCTDQFEGNCYFVGDLETPLNVDVGDQPVLREGDLSVSLGPFYLVEDE